MALPSTEMAETIDKEGLDSKIKCLGCVELKLTIRHPSAGVV